jgi:hypothetical protein
MATTFRRGECVRVPDGRPGRIREARGDTIRVRVRKRGGTTDEILAFPPWDLKAIEPPAGWMSPAGYNRRVAAVRRNAKRRADD